MTENRRRTFGSFLKIMLCILFCGCIITAGLYTSLQLVTYDDGFYAAQYKKYYVTYTTGIEEDELMRITDEIQLFLSGKRADFDIAANVMGTYRPIFDAQEQFHMLEVRQLYQTYAVARNISAVLLCVAAGLLAVCKIKYIWRALFNGALAALAFTMLIGVCAVIWFDPIFVLFHKIFFNNDLWLFDPDTSVLINIFSEGFFSAAALRIFLIFAALCLILCLTGYIFGQNNKKRYSNG